jgi:hypothetical protein
MRIELLARSLSCSLFCLALVAQTRTTDLPGASTAEDPANQFFRQEGLERSQVMEHLSWMCDVYGPRLTGSQNLKNAQDWAMATFTKWGLAHVQTEAWGPFGRSWRCEHASMTVLGANPWPVIAYPKAWSPSIEGRVEADVVYVGGMTKDQLEAADLKGKIVLLQKPRELGEPLTGISKRFDAEDLLGLVNQNRDARPERRASEAAAQNDFRMGFAQQQQVTDIVVAKAPLAIVDRGSKGDYGTVFVQGASAVAKPGDSAADPRQRTQARDVGASVLPQFTIAAEHYNRMVRILQKDLPVRVAVELKTVTSEQAVEDRNVVAEIPGADPKLGEQLVMLGGHFDSWHTGTGATDNGCGSAVAMEAVRLIRAFQQQSGQAPRRTIRVALWSGEEQGLLGSRAYVKQHFGARDAEGRLQLLPAAAKVAGYFNLDNGTGKVRGIYLQGNEACAPVFRSWLKPFHDLGAATVTIGDTGGTDHLAFDAIGLPGFQFIQDPVSYDTKTHHSNMDCWDHAVADDLKQASVLMAAFVWQTAQRDEMLPRKAVPEVVAPATRR